MGSELQLTFRAINNALENLLTGIIKVELIRKQFQDCGSGVQMSVWGSWLSTTSAVASLHIAEDANLAVTCSASASLPT